MINHKYRNIFYSNLLNFSLFFSFLLCINGVNEVYALEKSLSFSDCIKELKENNQELLALKFEKEAAIYKLKASKANYNPSLDLGAGASSNKVDTGFAKDSDMYNWNLTLSQNLFRGFRDMANVDLAYANEAQNLANIAIAEAKISSELKQAFSKISYYKKYLELAEKIVQRRKENFNVVNLRYEAGNENKGSFLKAKAQLAEAEFEKKQASRNLESSKYDLARILGRNSIEGLSIRGDVPHTKLKIANASSYINNHPKLLLAKANVALAKANVKIEESANYPTVDASLKTSGSGGSSSKAVDHTIGINANLPLLTFGRNSNSILEAKSNLSSMESREELSKQEIKSEIKTATANLESANEKVNVDENLREAAEVRAEIGRSKYNIGQLTFENWDIIESDLISYQKSELKSGHDLIISEANFEEALGMGVLND